MILEQFYFHTACVRRCRTDVHPEAPFRFLFYKGPFRAKFNTDVVISCGECHSVRTSLLHVAHYLILHPEYVNQPLTDHTETFLPIFIYRTAL